MAQQRNIIAFAALVLAGAATAPVAERGFEILGPEGQLVGIQTERESQTSEGREVWRERVMAYRVDGHGETTSSSRLIRVYRADGKLLRFRVEVSNGEQSMASEGTVSGSNIVLVRAIGGKRVQLTLAWPQGSDLADPLAVEQPRGARLELAANGLSLSRRDMRLVGTGDGRTLRLGMVDGRLDGAELVSPPGAAGTTALELPKLGYSLTLRRAERPLAAQLLASPKRLPHEMQKSPFYVPTGALNGHIRYRFGFRHGFMADLPQTGQQAIKVVPDGWQVDVCAQCGPGLASDPASLEQWRKPNAWIQSDAPEIVAATRRVAGSGQSDDAKMVRLGKIARDRLSKIDFEGYYPARTAWRRGGGDCTEDALVLAALARAAGIPARVASGMSYTRTSYHGAANAFLPHAWVVAWVDGHWKSYDISLEGFDVTHIALSLSDGEPGGYGEAMWLAALLDWQAMNEVRKRN